MTDRWQQWLVDQDRWNGDYAYRGIYAAWRCTVGVTTTDGGAEAHLRAREGGGFSLSTNSHHDPLEFADADEVRRFAAWLARRCCGDEYPDMRAWEHQQHEWFKEDLGNWTSG